MAKGLRSSVKKSNRTKLRANVFQPVETARAERIHQKILETLQQPKPEPPKKAAEMEVDSTEDTTAEPTEGEFPKGSSFLTAKIPRCLTTPNDSESYDSSDSSYFSDSDSIPPTSHKEDPNMSHLCFVLGLSSDIVGFTDDGDLEFAFDPLPL
ncbi:hypothetical protein M011DRAFT_474866 [Sporormia fimetaria CBS 119925]|uniref:DUF2423 domain-containing protein n=1 Tax=Sporormia fimetaria CBS 119925 TaxID=1340428 RepID=A0A6A6VJX6_9PLEO|nr:hypothetical protein M011DRAFT_474866 [Sporormia fimetaria CBS 119925]